MPSQNVNFERTLLSTTSDANTRDMAMTIFSGMVLESFQTASVFYDRAGEFMSIKQLNGAASAQWPIIGNDPFGSYHVPGTFINEQSSMGTNDKRIQMFQKTITTDEYLVNGLDIPFTDMNVLHFDVIGPFATKLGRNLAKILDRKIAILATKASLANAVTDVYATGMQINRTGSATIATAYPPSPSGAYNFRVDLAALAQKFDEASIPESGRYMFITPAIKTALRFEPAFYNSISSAGVYGTAVSGVVGTSVFQAAPSNYTGGSSMSDISSRVIGNLEGFQFVVTNNLPTTDLSAATGLSGEDLAVAYSSVTGTTGGKYQINALGTASNPRPVAVALCSAATGSPAIGMVQATGLQTHMEDDQRRNTKFLKAQLMCGLDVLCPWSAGSITVTAS
tara:strand:- start:1443 stop:2627 length:1185 start_codon:yes stop_codon:yes gene_type:complete